MSKISTIVEKYIEMMTKLEWTKICDFEKINSVLLKIKITINFIFTL